MYIYGGLVAGAAVGSLFKHKYLCRQTQTHGVRKWDDQDFHRYPLPIMKPDDAFQVRSHWRIDASPLGGGDWPDAQPFVSRVPYIPTDGSRSASKSSGGSPRYSRGQQRCWHPQCCRLTTFAARVPPRPGLISTEWQVRLILTRQ